MEKMFEKINAHCFCGHFKFLFSTKKVIQDCCGNKKKINVCQTHVKEVITRDRQRERERTTHFRQLTPTGHRL